MSIVIGIERHTGFHSMYCVLQCSYECLEERLRKDYFQMCWWYRDSTIIIGWYQYLGGSQNVGHWIKIKRMNFKYALYLGWKNQRYEVKNVEII